MKITRKSSIVAATALLVVMAVVIKAVLPVKAGYVSPRKRHLVQEVFGTGTVEARVLVTAGSKITGRVRSTLQAAGHETGAGTASSAYARARLEDAEVRASMDGVVVSRDAEEGDAVVPGSPIFRIADPETVWVKANIDEALGGGIARGIPAVVYLRSDGKTPLQGSVSRIAQESDRVTEEMEVNVSFPLKDKGRLHLGEQADVYVNGIEKGCLSIPIKAVTGRSQKAPAYPRT